MSGQLVGQAFTAQLTCPLTDNITLSAAFICEGVRQTQLLDQYSGLYSNSFPYVNLWGLESAFLDLSQEASGTFSLPAVTGILSYTSPSVESVNTSVGQSQWKSAQVGLFRNQHLVCWLEPTDQAPHNSEALPEIQGDYYYLPPTVLEAAESDEVEFAAMLTDEYGRSYVAPCLPGYVVSNGTLNWPEDKLFSNDPADWIF